MIGSVEDTSLETDAAVVLPNRQDLQELVATEVGAEACQKDAELQRYHAASVAHLERGQHGGPTADA
jgi:hypothetical protein